MAEFVLHRTLRWPFKDGDGAIVAGAVPGPAVHGGRGFIEVGGGIFLRDNSGADAIQLVQKLVIPRQGDRGLRAISIAPDSAIHTCDLWLGGNCEDGNHVRISPGNPLVGDLEGHDFALISIPVSIPEISSATAGAFGWDATTFQDGAGKFFAWPLKLDFWYCDLPPIRQHIRGPYHASIRVRQGAGEGRELFFCVDGRGRVAFEVIATNATLTFSVRSYLGVANTATPRVDQASNPGRTVVAAALLPAGFNRVEVVGPNNDARITPHIIVSAVMADSAGSGGGFHQVNLTAWDD